MSGTDQLCTAGFPLTDEDLQRMADAAANADNLVYDLLFDLSHEANATSATVKRVVPLVNNDDAETEAGGYGHLALAVTSPAGQGTIKIVPALYMLSALLSGDVAPTSLIVGRVKHETLVGPFASNSSGSTRIDLVYATVAQAAIVTEPRLVKDPNTGVETTQTVTLAQAPQVTFTILPGTPGAGAPMMPADSASAYNIALFQVTIATGYTAPANLNFTLINEVWTRLGIAPGIVRSVRQASGTIASSTGVLAAALPDRFANVRKIFAVIEHTAAGTFVLDQSIKYDNRMMSIRMVQVDAPPATMGHSYTNADSGLVYVPPATSFWTITTGFPNMGGNISFLTDASGHMTMSFASAVSGVANAYYVVEMTVYDAVR